MVGTWEHYATNRIVAGLIFSDVIEYFQFT
jgi:hypothetical protein